MRFGSAQSSPARRPSGSSGNVLSWQARGGPGRDHSTLMELQLSKVCAGVVLLIDTNYSNRSCVLQVRFRHEVYPETANVASRQVLLIQSLEIRDRLASSAINKFLYLHCTEAQPRQAHANMVRH